MAPITFHFRIFEAGASGCDSRSATIDNMSGMTGLCLKKNNFSADLAASKKIRFIVGGRILDDSLLLEKCNFASAAVFINVSISAGPPQSSTEPASEPQAANGPDDTAPVANEKGSHGIRESLLFGAALAVTGAIMVKTFKKHQRMSMQESRFLFVFAAIWIYVACWYGLPAVVNALRQAFQVSCRTTPARSAASSRAATVASSCGVASTSEVTQSNSAAEATPPQPPLAAPLLQPATGAAVLY